MSDAIIAFFSGASKVYDLFGSFDAQEKKQITIQSSFENIGKAFKKVIAQDVTTDTKNKTEQATKQ